MDIRIELTEDELRAVLAVIEPVVNEGDDAPLARAEAKLDSALLEYEQHHG